LAGGSWIEVAVGGDAAPDVEGAVGGDVDAELEELVDPSLLLGGGAREAGGGFFGEPLEVASRARSVAWVRLGGLAQEG